MALSSKKVYIVNNFFIPANTLDLWMKRYKYRVTEIYQHCPMVNKKLILMYKNLHVRFIKTNPWFFCCDQNCIPKILKLII